MSLKLFDWTTRLLWGAMALAFVVGFAGSVMWPEPAGYYPADSGMCDSGCSDLR